MILVAIGRASYYGYTLALHTTNPTRLSPGYKQYLEKKVLSSPYGLQG
jgi:hypothetical protein